MRRRLFWIALIIAPMTAHPCGDIEDPDNIAAFFSHEVAKEKFLEVKSSQRKMALRMLGRKRLVRLGASDTKKFEMPSELSGATHYYLLAATRATGSGAFSVFVKDECAMVLHGDLSHTENLGKPRPTALIFASDHALRDAFARSSVSQ